MARSVYFNRPPEVVFDYLVDPENRPEWQSSLKRVEDVDPGGAKVGQEWTDVTTPGLKPRMRTTVLERPTSWTEIGTWKGIDAELTLTFEAAGPGTNVTPRFEVRGKGLFAVPAFGADKVAVFAVIPDLKRAAKILAERPV